MADYVQKGHVIDYTAGGSAVAAGGVVVIGSLVGVAPRPIAANSLGAVAIEGVHALPKAVTGTDASMTAGQLVYWYATSGVAVVSHATGVKAGYAVAAAATGATTVSVKLER